MNDVNDSQTAQPNERPAAFCQNCGKPLDKDTMRVVGSSIYCEPCLTERLGTAGTVPGPGYTWVDPAYAGTIPPSNGPNPGLAGALGLIPGVGAMYNEQYAKGIVHLAIFAVLVTLADANGVFSLFVLGWVVYMAMEAHHTAKAKRDGLPLPNPFGLNDIGERMGFGREWNVANARAAARDTARAAGFPDATSAAPPPPSTAQSMGEAPPQPASAPGAWGAPVDSYPKPAGYTTPDPTAYAPGYGPGFGAAYGPSNPYGGPVPPYTPPYVPPYGSGYGSPLENPLATPRNRFPVGAVWLIGLGTLFLLGTEGIFKGLRGESLVGILMLAFGVTVFAKRMASTGATFQSDGTAQYQYRLLYALRPSVWLFLVGLLLLLDSFNVLHWRHSWPSFVILAGVMMLLNRAPYPDAATFYPSVPPTSPEAPVAPGTGLAPIAPVSPSASDEPQQGGR